MEGVIGQLVDRMTVSIHDRGDIDIANVDIDGHYEPPVIISKAILSSSKISIISRPQFKSQRVT
jgi:hypothetical protein